VTIDTLRADHLGTYGFPANASPNLDTLAKRGVVYERAIAASSRTAPAHASIFTSRWVRGHSIGHRNGSTALRDSATLASILRDAGWETAAFVSNVMLRRRIGLDHGFDVYDDDLPDVEIRRGVSERIAERTAKRALAWIAGSHQAPIFAWVHFNDPHGPYTAPPPTHEALVLPRQLDEPELPVLASSRGWHGIPGYQALEGLRRPSEYRSRYAEEIRYFDHWLGQLVDGFESSAGADSSVVLVTADHGETFGEEGFWFCHGFATTPDMIHVPLILSAPGLKPGRSPELVHHVDVAPTVLELVGLPVPKDAVGIALAPHWRARTSLPERVVFADVGNEVSAYVPNSFLRVRLRGDIGDMKERSIRLYQWGRDGRWTAAQGTDAERLRSVEAYISKQTPLRRASSLTEVDVERLRALGYVDVEKDAPSDSD
jgi:arylsulfatase